LAGDFDAFDIARVEVLRGPQGTLYGASSLGGVIKYVTAAPKLDRFEILGQAGVETTDGGGTGWSGNGVVNVPLGDSLAVRASGYYRRTAGYIDTLGIARKDANKFDSYGGRASLLFKPNESFSVRLSALAQNIRSNSAGSFDADPVTLKPLDTDPNTGAALDGRLARTEFYPESNDVDYRLYSGTATLDVGVATLTSITSYGTLRQKQFSDASYQLPGLADALYISPANPGPLGVVFPNNTSQKKFTQELRLSSQDSDRFEWQLGAYYTREKGRILQFYRPFDLATGNPVDPALTLPVGPGGSDVVFPNLLEAKLNSTYKEYAGFGSVTLKLSDRFDITAGGRYSHNKQSTLQSLDGSLLPLSGLAIGPDIKGGQSSENVFTWSISPRFELNDHIALYARAAKGYRPGGPNIVPPGAGSGFPTQFRADTLVSYEMGIRGENADRKLSFDASLYYLDWRDIQVLVTYQTNIGPVTADGNGKTARSVGAELTATARPIAGLNITGSISYNDAKLTADLPLGNGGFDGDRLPYAPQWSANVSADYEWALSDKAQAFVGGNIHLVSDQATDFDNGYLATFGRRMVIDGYQNVDLRAGVEFGTITVSLYAKNITNALGLVNAGRFGTRPGTAVNATPIRPRVMGATLSFRF
jgi:iron complex outermembrane recepter protein